MDKDITQLHRRLKRSKIALFSIVAFLCLLTFGLIMISQYMSSNEQAMTLQSRASTSFTPAYPGVINYSPNPAIETLSESKSTNYLVFQLWGVMSYATPTPTGVPLPYIFNRWVSAEAFVKIPDGEPVKLAPEELLPNIYYKSCTEDGKCRTERFDPNMYGWEFKWGPAPLVANGVPYGTRQMYHFPKEAQGEESPSAFGPQIRFDYNVCAFLIDRSDYDIHIQSVLYPDWFAYKTKSESGDGFEWSGIYEKGSSCQP